MFFPVVAGALALCLAPSVSLAQSSSSRHIDVPPVPVSLEVPDGNEVFLEGQAVGTQNYVCLPSGAGFAWRFLGPQATLFVSRKGHLQRQITTHFLSLNPAEGLPRPAWQSSSDSSMVWGRLYAPPSSDPAYVAPGAIPWLLLESAGAAIGPTNGALLAQTTFIHRVNTAGGIAPLTGCTQSSEVGAVALVPYTTDYFFYRASRK
jgi:hypothetical protein